MSYKGRINYTRNVIYSLQFRSSLLLSSENAASKVGQRHSCESVPLLLACLLCSVTRLALCHLIKLLLAVVSLATPPPVLCFTVVLICELSCMQARPRDEGSTHAYVGGGGADGVDIARAFIG